MNLLFLDYLAAANKHGRSVSRFLADKLPAKVLLCYHDAGRSQDTATDASSAAQQLTRLSMSRCWETADLLVFHAWPLSSHLESLPEAALRNKAWLSINYASSSQPEGLCGAPLPPSAEASSYPLGRLFLSPPGIADAETISGSNQRHLEKLLPQITLATQWISRRHRLLDSLALAEIYAAAPIAATAF